MTRSVVFVFIWLVAAAIANAEAPAVKVTVRELLAHPQKFDGQRVDVRGYYTAGMEDSQLWPSARVAKRARSLDESVYVDASVYGPPKPPHIPDPDTVKNRYVRIVGEFHARRLEPGIWNSPSGPNIRKASYFQPSR